MLPNIGKDTFISIKRGKTMKRIIINDYFLKDEDIDFSVVRAKALLLNSNGEILIAHNNNTYQFIGGHLKEGESLEECLQREIKEETGIQIKITKPPFMNIVTYDNDYFDSGKKVKNKIYYYRIETDSNPNFAETNYDELELDTEFKLFYIKIQDLERFLNESLQDKSIDPKIGREMLYVLKEYDKLYGGI